ncbi:hypothetical protein [Mycobacterium hubeiense]|uniref:hypothetical protein n=1 Tax=Mycobacterium hubeiense TaxID=1867256 RepID=UPI000C7F5BE8|nr:hypothetical protein [Mycobacterium sp. QGD 101]
MSAVQSSDPAGMLRKPTITPGAASGPGVGLPTRSKIEDWTDAINDLSRFAAVYGASANKLEIAADAHVQQLSAPGGTDWEGPAADQARETGYADRGVVWQAADLMRAMQKVANQGAGTLSQARELALDAIAQAEADDFKVSDDLTVTDLRRYTSQQLGMYEARKTKAEQHHSYIAMRAGTLASEDAKIGGELHAAAISLDGMIPQNWDTPNGNGAIQAVDYKQSPHSGDTNESPKIPGPKPAPPPDSGQAPHGSQPWYSRGDDVLFEKLAENAADAAEAQGWTHAARNLRHYLGNSGDDLTVNPDEIMRDVPQIQQTTDDLVNSEVQRIAAEAATTGNYGNPVQFQTDWTGPYIGPEDSKDWFYAMGGIQQSVSGVVTVHPPAVPGGEPTVTVDYQTHVFDRYNWDGNKTTTFDVPGTDGVTISDKRMGALHTAGLAQEYNISGSGSVFHYEGALPSNAPLDLPSAPDNRDGTRTDPGRYSPGDYGPGRDAG